MSNPYSEGVDAIRRMAVTYKNIVGVADALEKVGSIEQAMQEAIAARDKAQAERDMLLALNFEQAEVANQEIASATAKAQKILSDAQEQSAAEADLLVSSAHTEANRIVTDANQTAINTLAKMAVERSDMDNAIAVLTDHKNALNNDVNELKQSVGELQGVKFALEAEIATLKAKFA